MPQQPSARGLIFRNGIIFGAIIAAIALANVFINWQLGSYNILAQAGTGTPTTTLNGGTTLLGCAVYLVDLGLLFVAGILTARKTGSVGAASLTGLVAGLIGALVGSGIALVLIMTVIAPQIQVPADSPISQNQLQTIIIGGAVLGIVIALIVDGGFGAGIGALGGLVGRNTYQQANPPQPYQQSFYPGAMGQPGAYPPPPPYTGPQYPPQPYAGPQYPAAPQYPAQTDYPAAPAQQPQPQEPQPPQQG